VLSLKTRVLKFFTVLKYFLSFRIIEQLALALKILSHGVAFLPALYAYDSACIDLGMSFGKIKSRNLYSKLRRNHKAMVTFFSYLSTLSNAPTTHHYIT